jgi:hypothetical protein
MSLTTVARKSLPQASAYPAFVCARYVSKFWNLYKSKTVLIRSCEKLDPAKMLNRQQLAVGSQVALALQFPLPSKRIH